MTPSPTTSHPRRRVRVFCLTYGEPAENEFGPQFEYSHLILNRLTRRVAPIPKFVTPLLAARRARIRMNTFRELNWNSPLERHSADQARVLHELLAQADPSADFTVEVLREFRPPLLPEILAKLESDPPDEILIVPLYVAESDFTTGISRTDFEDYYRSRKGQTALPAPRYVVGFGFDDRFADAYADFIRRYCREHDWDDAKLKQSALILGAHGTVVTLPAGMNSGAQETGNLFRLLRKRLGGTFGWVRIGWLNHQLGGMWTCPSVETSAEQAHKRGLRNVVYFPFGFIGDNGESMIEGRQQLAVVEWDDMLYLPCPNDDRVVMQVLADMTQERRAQPPEDWNTIGRGNPAFERPEMPAERGAPGLLKFSGPVLAALACAFWTAIGVFLTVRGVRTAMHIDSAVVLSLVGVFSLLIAWIKGQGLLARLALKNLKRLRAIPQPSPLHHLFSRASWTVILFFTCVGISLRFIPMPNGLRATILIGVGAAMLVGAFAYVRHFGQSRPIRVDMPLQPVPPARQTA